MPGLRVSLMILSAWLTKNSGRFTVIGAGPVSGTGGTTSAAGWAWPPPAASVP